MHPQYTWFIVLGGFWGFYISLVYCTANKTCKKIWCFYKRRLGIIVEDFRNYNEDECPICLENFDDQRKPSFLKSCGNRNHPLHHECLLESIQKCGSKCPICRKEIKVSLI